MSKPNTRITELDFVDIKQNLKNFLKSQPEFTGYNFEGAAMNVLLDVLAHNTFYQAFYNNMTINEMFLDSATKRSSIVSLAKHFAYRPRTVLAASCLVNVVTDDLSQRILPRGTKIRAVKDNEAFEFILVADATFTPSEFLDGQAVAQETGPVEFKQGRLKKYSFVVDGNDETQKFTIPFRNADASTLVVRVQESTSSATIEDYAEATNITAVNEESKVYFVEENSDGLLQVFFGDGVLGKRLSDGNVVRIEVIDTDGESANGIGIESSTTTFSISEVSGYVKVLLPSAGGTKKEAKESIRLNATRTYTTQERAVTKEDYRNILLKDYANLDDVICWGGEDNTPKQYGKVFISIKPKNGAFLSNYEKESIVTSLTNSRNVVGVLVEVVEPEVLYLNLTINVKVDPVKLVGGIENLKSAIIETTQDFTNTTLSKFDKDFYAAELIEVIQDLNEAIISTDVGVTIEKRFTPTFDAVPHNYTLDFNNALYHPEAGFKPILASNLFGYLDKNGVDRDCRLDDDGNGKVRVYYTVNGVKNFITTNAGTIDYSTGRVSLLNFKPSSLINNTPISLVVQPAERDIAAKQKMFLLHEDESSTSLAVNVTQVPYRNR